MPDTPAAALADALRGWHSDESDDYDLEAEVAMDRLAAAGWRVVPVSTESLITLQCIAEADPAGIAPAVYRGALIRALELLAAAPGGE